jgi:hypothetical protein
MNTIWKKQGKYLRSWLNKNDQNPRHFKFLKMKNGMDSFSNRRKTDIIILLKENLSEKIHSRSSRRGISGVKLINRISHAIYIKFIKVSRQKCSWSQDPEIKE